ncbi:endonuclease domain-containing 1 protein-like [Oncorhynchus tshawytscha]|uniref:endonuclease domain-containing 1 protein-like n=1 Tax=Oncorhynchus tshawytscha TaxID=74940 RepID=UPI001C3DAA8A|nr:endonuclease domain-containing 1 protein-like [Oncorhynchus tshawytscha]
MMGVLSHLSTLLLLLSLLPPALSHVVERFSDVTDCETFFLEGTTPNLPGILVGGTVQNQNRYKPICQKYKKTYRFATLYDTTNRIPVFSAYTFTGVGPRGTRPDTWMIEPQLDGGIEPVMGLEKQGVIYTHQAVNQDYDEYGKDKKVNKGHLFPKSFAHQPVNQDSTFTLTNAVPQVKTFNEGSWGKMECTVRKILRKQCLDNNGQPKAYVLTGAVPSVNNKLNNRVNIPDLLWTAYCCYNSKKKEWMAKAHWGENQEETNKQVLNPHTLSELYNMLKQHYPGGDVQVFPDQCPRGSSQKEREKSREREIGSGDISGKGLMTCDEDCKCVSL